MTLKQMNMTQICCQAQCEVSLQKSKDMILTLLVCIYE